MTAKNPDQFTPIRFPDHTYPPDLLKKSPIATCTFPIENCLAEPPELGVAAFNPHYIRPTSRLELLQQLQPQGTLTGASIIHLLLFVTAHPREPLSGPVIATGQGMPSEEVIFVHQEDHVLILDRAPLEQLIGHPNCRVLVCEDQDRILH